VFFSEHSVVVVLNRAQVAIDLLTV